MGEKNPESYKKNQKARVRIKRVKSGLIWALVVLAVVALYFCDNSVASFFKIFGWGTVLIIGTVGLAAYFNAKNKRNQKKAVNNSAVRQSTGDFYSNRPTETMKKKPGNTVKPVKKNFNWVMDEPGSEKNVHPDIPSARTETSIDEIRNDIENRRAFLNMLSMRSAPASQDEGEKVQDTAESTEESRHTIVIQEYEDSQDEGIALNIEEEDCEEDFTGTEETDDFQELYACTDETCEYSEEDNHLRSYKLDEVYMAESDMEEHEEEEDEAEPYEPDFKDNVGERKAEGTGTDYGIWKADLSGEKEKREYKAESRVYSEAYSFPDMNLLRKQEAEAFTKDVLSGIESERNAKKLIDTLKSFGVGARIINISAGPTVTRYELQPDYGVKVSKIVNLSDDIALNLAAMGVRIEAPIPGKAAIGIEIPNREVTPVLLRDVIESDEFFNSASKLAFAVGKDIAGNVVVADISKMPHLLIAGATGAGKSVCINTLIASILYKTLPSEVKLLMVDPKVVELSIYNGIPHLLIPVVTDPKKAAGALNWAVQEMTNRYKLFADNNVRNLKGYNALMKEKGDANILPHIVIIIDELADLMMVAPNDVEDCICRLAQMARAAGMHLVIATQRPSVDVITGVIKANIPSRISFAVSSQIDSRTILDMAGAEKLLGRGDMLFSPIGLPKPMRVQGALITDGEVEAIVSHIKANSSVQYDDDIIDKIDKQTESAQPDTDGDDELLPQVVDMIIEQGQASTSLIQRKFKIGYSRAARILDQLEARGIVGPFEGSKPRKIMITRQQWLEMNN